MRATNHVLTGALIGASISQPAVALPLALVSHFALDALPHSGGDDHTTKRFLIELFIDGILVFILLLFILDRQPHNWLLMVACGLLAASPDLMWLPRYLKELKLGHMIKKPSNFINRFHSWIQWGERPYYWWIEFVWGATILASLVMSSKI